MADETSNRRDRPDVAAALMEPAFASLSRAGAPIVVAEGEPPLVVHANAAALSLFDVADGEDLTQRLFVSEEPGARRLTHLAQTILPGAAARLERLHLRFARFPENVTFLCRRTSGDNPLFVFAGLGLRARVGRAHPAAEPAPQAPVAETTPQVREDLAALSAELKQRFPGLAAARFLWRADAKNVVTQVTPPLADIVGPGCANFVGRDFVAAAQALGLDPERKLERALRDRLTFSRLDVDWPIENAAAAVPVTLGALPAFDHHQQFDGWRGFGVIHLDSLREAARIAPPFAGAAPPPNGAVEALHYSGVVVPLRPHAPQRPAAAPEPEAESRASDLTRGALKMHEEEEGVLVALAPHERSAFREIARTLGARAESGGAAAAPSEQASEATSLALQAEEAAPADAPEHNPEPAPVAGDCFDFLPVGLLVAREKNAIFANRALLDWLGFGDLAELEQAGGLRAACQSGTLDLAPSERRLILLRSVAGETFAVEAQRAEAAWQGAPAEIFTFVRPPAPALEQRVAALEAALRRRETEAEEALDILGAACDAFALLNAEGALLGLNPSAEALFGYGRDEVAGKDFTFLLAKESHSAALEFFARVKAEGRNGGGDLIGRTRQGEAIALRVTFGRVGPAAEGKYCAILRDIGEWKKAEGAMEEARVLAERDSEAKSEFLARVSHEIRTPLNAIIGFAEVIMEERFGPVGNERYKEYLKDIHASGSHVMSLVNDLLDLSKIEAGKMELAFAAVDANRIVSECVALIQPQANRERVITRLSLAPGLPAVYADERSLRQIVLNLLANAVRYNEPGGQVIVSTALSDDGHAVLRVRDTGVGMSDSELLRAMEPFHQVGPASSRPGGTGLGLPLTKALAEANHASFTIRSRKGEGALVEIAFPLAPEGAKIVAKSAGAGDAT